TIVSADRIERRGTTGRSNAGLFVLALVLATGTVLGPPSSAHAGAHENAMSSVLFKSRARLRVAVEPIDTAIDVHYQGMGDRDEANFTLDRLEGASHRFIRYLEDRGVEARPCRNHKLDLYDLDREVLNDRERMSFFSFESDIAGLYDSRYSQRGHSTIFLSQSLDRSERARTIDHEVAHYWHDMLCLSREGLDTEEIARDFEGYSENMALGLL
ncbi:MAG: hypothetical protein QGG40_21660, partial [Myxococcota bacterium]|nr:hypothetical protein [Myxococcota bacterium]